MASRLADGLQRELIGDYIATLPAFQWPLVWPMVCNRPQRLARLLLLRFNGLSFGRWSATAAFVNSRCHWLYNHTLQTSQKFNSFLCLCPLDFASAQTQKTNEFIGGNAFAEMSNDFTAFGGCLQRTAGTRYLLSDCIKNPRLNGR